MQGGADAATILASKPDREDAADRRWKLHQDVSIEKVLEMQQRQQQQQKQQQQQQQQKGQKVEEEQHPQHLPQQLSSDTRADAEEKEEGGAFSQQAEDIVLLRQQLDALQVRRLFLTVLQQL
jgi:hypothetical protein